MWIQIDLKRIRIQLRFQGFYNQKLKKNYYWKTFFLYVFDQKLQFTYPSASIKDAQATGEALTF
jgi:hypothetical protein